MCAFFSKSYWEILSIRKKTCTTKIRVVLHFQPVNDEPPHIVTEQLFVKEGQAVTLTNASMYVVDLDTDPEDLILTLRLPPTSG